VVIVPRGADVLPKMDETQPDIVLMDYHLSDMEGADIIRDLRQLPRYAHIPIIMASGMDVERESMKAGASSFLLKPFEPDELPALFNRLLAASQS
jgi:CheY-like chemotaxis protein